jgi:hypothetical protein
MAHQIGSDFILGGKAIFTISNPAGEHYTYKVNRKDPEPGGPYGDKPTYFVKLLTGPDNGSDYTYLGILTDGGLVKLTRASRFTDDTKPVRVIRWAAGIVFSGRTLPPGYALQHDGRCGRCGRRLTVPESIDSGFGPECAGRIGGGRRIMLEDTAAAPVAA